MRKSYLPLIAIIVLAVTFYSATMIVLVFNIQPPLTATSSVSGKTPTVNVLLYEGEITGSTYGFGNSSTTITSPDQRLHSKLQTS